MVLLEVKDIAVGDYSDEYGTVEIAEDHGETVYIKFVNGTEISPSKDTEMRIDQGGRFNHEH